MQSKAEVSRSCYEPHPLVPMVLASQPPATHTRPPPIACCSCRFDKGRLIVLPTSPSWGGLTALCH